MLFQKKDAHDEDHASEEVQCYVEQEHPSRDCLTVVFSAIEEGAISILECVVRPVVKLLAIEAEHGDLRGDDDDDDEDGEDVGANDAFKGTTPVHCFDV